MKAAFMIYPEVLQRRIREMFSDLQIDFYTEWEMVKGKGHQTDAHLGTRVFPGYNNVRFLAFQDDSIINSLKEKITETNSQVRKKDDCIRLFVLPMEEML